MRLLLIAIFSLSTSIAFSQVLKATYQITYIDDSLNGGFWAPWENKMDSVYDRALQGKTRVSGQFSFNPESLNDSLRLVYLRFQQRIMKNNSKLISYADENTTYLIRNMDASTPNREVKVQHPSNLFIINRRDNTCIFIRDTQSFCFTIDTATINFKSTGRHKTVQGYKSTEYTAKYKEDVIGIWISKDLPVYVTPGFQSNKGGGITGITYNKYVSLDLMSLEKSEFPKYQLQPSCKEWNKMNLLTRLINTIK